MSLSLFYNSQVKAIYEDEFKGIFSPAVLADINLDGTEDIIMAMFNSTVVAFDGRTFQILWNYTFLSSESLTYVSSSFMYDFVFKKRAVNL